eukprot:13601-Heterococcus_DN1.PRE.3
MVLLYSLFERELQHKSMQQAAAYLVISCCLNKSVQLSLTGNVHDYELRHMCCCYRHGWTTATRCIMKKSQLFRQQHAQCADICVLTALNNMLLDELQLYALQYYSQYKPCHCSMNTHIRHEYTTVKLL